MSKAGLVRGGNPKIDPMPDVPRAGAVFAGNGETAAMCIEPPEPVQRAVTPENIKKYRMLDNSEPGQKVLHPGFVGLPMPPEEFRYGVAPGPADPVRAKDMINPPAPSRMGQYLAERQEGIYRTAQREPLEHTYVRGFRFPEQTKDPNFRFGVVNKYGEDAKSIMFPTQQRAVVSEEEVTQPIRRNYDWQKAGVDPDAFRFGAVDPNKESNGVAKTLNEGDPTRIIQASAEKVAIMRHDPLGHAPESRALSKPDPNMVFGVASGAADEWGAGQCIRGAYTADQQQPDRDLSVSTTRFRGGPQYDQDRIYGLPSVRIDRQPPKQRSVANNMNYGDEENVKRLLYPPKFAFDGVGDDDFTKERSKAEIRDIFEKTGVVLMDDEFERACVLATSNGRALSVDSFKQAVAVLTPLNKT